MCVLKSVQAGTYTVWIQVEMHHTLSATTAHKNLFLLLSLLSPSLTPPLPRLIKIDESV